MTPLTGCYGKVKTINLTPSKTQLTFTDGSKASIEYTEDVQVDDIIMIDTHGRIWKR